MNNAQKQIINSVTFFGCSCGEPGDPNFESAQAVAKEVALSGRRVVNGGGPGVMLAATLGAKAGKGKTTVYYSKRDRKSTLNSSHQIISYAVFCLKKKKRTPEYTRCV